jgi:hypothetical protein
VAVFDEDRVKDRAESKAEDMMRDIIITGAVLYLCFFT